LSSHDVCATQVKEATADVERFLSGTMTIDRLSTMLKVRIAEMEALGADPAWIADLRSLRNGIEYVNAFWIESGREELDAEEIASASKAAEAVKAALSRHEAGSR